MPVVLDWCEEVLPVMHRQELTGRLRDLADKMERYKSAGRCTAAVPSVSLVSWIVELRRLEAAVHALPDMRPVDW